MALKRDYQIELDPKDIRRNLLTKKYSPQSFRWAPTKIGSVIIEGIELCEPCG